MTTQNAHSVVQPRLTLSVTTQAIEGVYPVRPSDPEEAFMLYRGLDTFPCKTESYQSYILRCYQEEGAAPGHPHAWRFVVQEVSNEQQQWKFDSFGQVVDFLLDKLLKEQK